MKIVRAMKQVKRLQGEINDIRNRISNSIRQLQENEYLEQIAELKTQLQEKVHRLKTLKTRIMHTNVRANMFGVILEIGELKGHIEYLKSLDVSSGACYVGYSDTKQTYKSQITEKEKRKLVERCQSKINELTDKLDEFNHDTDIVEVEVADTHLF